MLLVSSILLASLSSLVVAQDAYSCDASKCIPPACRCASATPPVQNPPQFVLVTYDDGISSSVWDNAQAILRDRRNPNGCPGLATWFAQVFFTDPFLATQWYAQGHEVADHSVSHGMFTGNVFAGTYAEIEGNRAFFNAYAGIPLGKIRGVRFPFRNYTVDSLNMLSKMGFEYDSSMSALGNDKFWPYTLDYGAANECPAPGTAGPNTITVCGRKLEAPGLWEVPMYGFSSNSGQHLMDAYNDPSVSNPVPLQELDQAMRRAFDSTYNSNRVPFGIYMHPQWIGPASGNVPDGRNKSQMIRNVLDYVMSRPDTWMVTTSQLVQYMKNPVPASQLGSQPYMQCSHLRNAPTNICNGLGSTGINRCNTPNQTLTSCYGCPESYPTVANPAPNRIGDNCPVPRDCDTLYWDPVGCRCLCTNDACRYNETARAINLDPASLNAVPPGGNKSTSLSGNNARNSATANSVSSLIGAVHGIVLLVSFLTVYAM